MLNFKYIIEVFLDILKNYEFLYIIEYKIHFYIYSNKNKIKHIYSSYVYSSFFLRNLILCKKSSSKIKINAWIIFLC